MQPFMTGIKSDLPPLTQYSVDTSNHKRYTEQSPHAARNSFTNNKDRSIVDRTIGDVPDREKVTSTDLGRCVSYSVLPW